MLLKARILISKISKTINIEIKHASYTKLHDIKTNNYYKFIMLLKCVWDMIELNQMNTLCFDTIDKWLLEPFYQFEYSLWIFKGTV